MKKYNNKLEEIKSISTMLLLNSHYGNIITEQERLDDTFVSTINKIYIISKQDFSIQQAKSIIEKILSCLTEQELNYFKERFIQLDPQNKIIPEIIKITTIKEINKCQESK
jgi:hypothetical protein